MLCNETRAECHCRGLEVFVLHILPAESYIFDGLCDLAVRPTRDFKHTPYQRFSTAAGAPKGLTAANLRRLTLLEARGCRFAMQAANRTRLRFRMFGCWSFVFLALYLLPCAYDKFAIPHEVG